MWVKLGIALAASLIVAAAADPAPPGTLIDIGGYRVHLYCTGTGSPTAVVVGGGFSVDWELVQPQVARRTRVCTYDPSGTAWSDPFPRATPPPTCSERIDELRQVLRHASIDPPYVLVGFSIGGLYARLFAHRYPKEVSGMVIVDHAFLDPGIDSASPPVPVSDVDTPPVLLSKTPIVLGIEDDRNFAKLPRRNQELHAWATAHSPLRPTPETAAECAASVEQTTGTLGAIPLVVISTPNDSRGYRELQTRLLQLSTNSKQVVAANSTHMVIIDEPDVVINAIAQVVAAVRNRTAMASVPAFRGAPRRRTNPTFR